MLYRDNVREDGRVMGPHELVYEDYILDTITGQLDGDFSTIIKLDENPLYFWVDIYDVCVRYPTYVKMYSDGQSKIIDPDIYKYLGVVDENGALHFTTDIGSGVWSNYSKKCKRLINIKWAVGWETGVRNVEYYYEYVNHQNEIIVDEQLTNITISGRFKLVENNENLIIYDFEKDMLYVGEPILTEQFDKVCKLIVHMNVQMDAVEMFTSDGNKYLIYRDAFVQTDEEWSIRPKCTNMKSARNI